MSYLESQEDIERPARARMRSYDDKAHDVQDKPPASSGLATLALSLITFLLRPLRPLLPHMFPLLVCLLCIPVLMFISGAAGWVVWRNVPVGWRADLFLQYGDAVNPFANVQLPPILADQPYDISLHLVLPATESNYALGNFMATLKLTTVYNESILTIRRPAVLVPPHSSLVKHVLLGSPVTVKLEVPLASQFVSGTSTVHARLEVGRTDGWRGIGNGNGRELSVLEATLKGTVRPRGILAILARYPRLTTFVSTFTFFFISLLVVCGFLFTAFRSGSPQQPASPSGKGNSDSEDGRGSPGPDPAEKRYAGRRAFKRESGSSFSVSDDEKTSHQERPSASGSGVPASGLRKRRTSLTLESLKKGHNLRPSQVKIEVDDLVSRQNTTPPLYPKSPYPHPSVTDSDSNSQRQTTATDPVSPSDGDSES